MLGVFVNSLEFHYSTKSDSARGALGACLLTSVPELPEHVLESVKTVLSEIEPLPIPLRFEGEF